MKLASVRRSTAAPNAAAAVRSVSPAVLRAGRSEDAAALFELISRHLDEGHLLPRRLEALVCHAQRFFVAVNEGQIVACAELGPLSAAVAEVRSLVVATSWRGAGIGERGRKPYSPTRSIAALRWPTPLAAVTRASPARRFCNSSARS